MNNNSTDDYKLTDEPQLVQERNAIAHETEVPFAKMLMSPEHYNGPMHRFWGPLFVFCYGKSVEELRLS
jgi:hypothetical protein